MKLNTEWAFKLMLFIWKSYDGENFEKGSFIKSALSYLWFRFWFLAASYNAARYCFLAVLPADKRLVWEFYLGKLLNSINNWFLFIENLFKTYLKNS